ncbi:MAG: hypothetical protein QXT28_11845 [Thermofilaceae archaeon]
MALVIRFELLPRAASLLRDLPYAYRFDRMTRLPLELLVPGNEL